MARQLFPGEDAIGRELTADLPGWKPFTVVGVVGDVRHTGLRIDAEPLAYLPMMHASQLFELGTVSFIIRSGVPLSSLLGGAETVVAAASE